MAKVSTKGVSEDVQVLDEEFNKTYDKGVVLPYKNNDPQVEKKFLEVFLKEHPDWQEASIAYGVAAEITCKITQAYLDSVLSDFFHNHVEFFKGMQKVIVHERWITTQYN